MKDIKLETAISRCKDEIAKFNKKTFKVLFFVYDTKGVPSGSLTYIYKTAYALKKEGYNVHLLHSETEFVGVGDWLGEKYASLPHIQMGTEGLAITTSDFLFIPEIYSNVMADTKELPCKRIVIMQNFDFMTELIPVGATWSDLKIDTFVSTSTKLAERVRDVFPNTKYYVVEPCVAKEFNKNGVEDKLVVNIISKDNGDINAIVKPFKWKFPMYGFVAFRHLAGKSKEDFAEALKESAITVWNDPFTDFGISALEAMACGNIVIGKIPESEPEWMFENETLKDNGLWYYNTKDVPSLIAKAVQTYLYNAVPNEMKESMSETVSKYTEDSFISNVKTTYKDIFVERETELRETLSRLVKKLEESKTEE